MFFIFINFVSFMGVHPNFTHEIPCIKIHDKVINFMLVSSCVSCVGFTRSFKLFFIDVLTWSG
jgi:hypothetical protein